jgi:ATP-dependent helicase/nuclease subunit A
MTLPASITFISAGAGSGKTYRLTEILLQRLRSRAAEPSGVLATTFTNKAANELRERVQTDLLKAGEHAYAQAMGQARIGTVNSVCGALVQRFAFELGLPPVLQVLDEIAKKALIREAMDVAIEQSVMERIDQIAGRFGVTTEDWQKELGRLVDNARANAIDSEAVRAMGDRNARELLRLFPKATGDDLDAAMRRAIEVVAPGLRAAWFREKPKPVKKTQECLDLLEEFDRHLEDGDAPWSMWIKVPKEKPEKGLIDAMAPVYELAARVTEHPRLQAELREYLALMFGACADVMQAYAARKRELGVIDFTDQERLLLQALEQPQVCEVLAEELQLLMVDEFQDTSPIQLALFVKLAAFARETIWVGDLKQAIYGFRGSDAALMREVLAALPASGAHKEILGKSWRSRPSLVTLVNEAFTHAFSDVLEPGEVQLAPERTEPEGLCTFMDWQLEGGNKGEHQQALALGVQTLVASGHEIEDPEHRAPRPVRYGDVAILARSNVNVREITARLRANGIPVATMQPGLLKQPECILALACLRRLYDRADTVATAEILALADGTDPEAWLADRLKYLQGGGESYSWRERGGDVHPILARLFELRSELLLVAPREALQMVIIQCGLVGRVLRWTRDDSLGRSRIANLDRLIDLAKEYEDVCRSRRRVGTIAGMLLWFEEQADEKEDDIAVPALDAVAVLTHHAAKGLEWPVVVLTDLADDIKTSLWNITTMSADKFDVADPLKGRFIRYWPWPFGKQEKCDFADHVQASPAGKYWSARARAEEIRLLYVSMTRARDLLVFGRQQKKLVGPWLNAIDAPWLLPDAPEDELTLPSGARIRRAVRTMSAIPPDAAAVERPPIHWLDSWEPGTELRSLHLSPSLSDPVDCEVGRFEPVGTRIPMKGGTNVTDLGTAVHAAIAASVASGGAALAPAEIERLLAAVGVQSRVDAANVHRQIEAMLAWLERRWPGHRRYAEIAVESVLDSGQLLRGQVDLLLEVERGWVLVDHKSGPANSEEWTAAATKYSGQLAAYSEAIARASGKPVLETWLFLPVAGGAIPIQFLGRRS